MIIVFTLQTAATYQNVPVKTSKYRSLPPNVSPPTSGQEQLQQVSANSAKYDQISLQSEGSHSVGQLRSAGQQSVKSSDQEDSASLRGENNKMGKSATDAKPKKRKSFFGRKK